MSKKDKTQRKQTLGINFSKNLVSLRKAKQISQYDLADAMNVKRTQISQWESGRNNPTLETIERVAEFFDVPSILLLEDEQTDNKEGRSSRLDKQIKRIKLLSAHKQRMITNMLEAALNTD